jgi:5-amino-6-(5-phosphoribosylamino)uracil reductase
MFVFSNLATSLDGKIAPANRELFHLGTPADRAHMLELRRECDAILMGASTLRAYRKPCLAPADAASQPMNVVLSSRLEGFSVSWSFFKSPRMRRVLLTGPGTPARSIRLYEKSCEVIALKRSTRGNPVADQVITALSKLGVKRLLIEGGGELMWDFVSRDLIDEYHLTHTPRLLGGGAAPTLVGGPGLKPREIINVRLTQCRVVGDELYLVYRKTGRRG